MLPIKKIYIDSESKRHDSISTSNFKIELPYTLTSLTIQSSMLMMCVFLMFGIPLKSA